MRIPVALAAIPILLCLACVAKGQPVETTAKGLLVKEAPFGDPEIVVLKSMPPQFEVVFEREMPTPGWKFDIDEISTDPQTSRIVVRVTEVRPGGIAAQVMTPTKLKVALGTLPRGQYFLELQVRRGSGRHVPVQGFLLNAY